MADDADDKCEESGAGARIVRIPPIPRYWFDRWGNAARQIEDGSWVRYDDHVALMQRMQLKIQKLKETITELSKCPN